MRWRQPGARSGGTTDADRLHDVMAAISLEVIADRRHGRVMPHRGTAWLQEEWKQSLSMMGELRDNIPPGERSRRGQLIKTLPDEVLEHYPDLRDKSLRRRKVLGPVELAEETPGGGLLNSICSSSE